MKEPKCITDTFDAGGCNQKIGRQYAQNTLEYQCNHGEHAGSNDESPDAGYRLSVKKRIDDPGKTDQRKNNPETPQAVRKRDVTDDEQDDRVYGQ